MDEERPDGHLRDVADGCGCTEIWEYTSDARAAGAEEEKEEERGEVVDGDGGADEGTTSDDATDAGAASDDVADAEG